MSDKIYDTPSEVDAEKGKVVVDGPDGVAVLLTPEAVSEISHRLMGAAVRAKDQRAAQTRRVRH